MNGVAEMLGAEMGVKGSGWGQEWLLGAQIPV